MQNGKSLFRLISAMFTILATAVASAQSNLERPPLGMNLSEVRDYEPQQAFLNLFKQARPWITQSAKVWDTQETLKLDEHGWVKSLDKNANYDAVGTLLNNIGKDIYPAGRYVVLYDGEGKITYRAAASKIEADSAPGRDVIKYDPSNELGIHLQITETNPNNYIRNIRVYYEPTLPLIESDIIFNPQWIEKIQYFNSLRFMNWMETNRATEEMGHWQTRAKIEDASYANGKGVPLELMIRLANQIGADPWFTIPHTADDAYIRNFATMVRDRLRPELKAYFEFSNEVWNQIFPQHDYAKKAGQKRWGNTESPQLQWYGMRTAQMANIVDSVFTNQTQRAINIIATFTTVKGREIPLLEAPAWVAEGNPTPASQVDAYAIAGYFEGGIGYSGNTAQVLNWAKDYNANKADAFKQLREGGLLKDDGHPLSWLLNMFQYHADVAQKHGLQLVAYEGGQHVVSQSKNEDEANFLIQMNRDAEMGKLYLTLLKGWKNAGGTLFQHFVDVSRFRSNGTFGALENLKQSNPKYDALITFSRQNPIWWESRDSAVYNTSRHLSGSSQSETLNGGPGNDWLFSIGGSDTLDGKSGIDTAVMPFALAEYELKTQDTTTVALQRGQQIITLRNIELVKFADTLPLLLAKLADSVVPVFDMHSSMLRIPLASVAGSAIPWQATLRLVETSPALLFMLQNATPASIPSYGTQASYQSKILTLPQLTVINGGVTANFDVTLRLTDQGYFAVTQIK